ncbi:DUF4186 family protein [Bradyrhizobium betae]|uniref:DUF4186 family protein n=1 Tax=Bradyrhizobium betae TaxID=244734 RepID=UPI003D67DE5F
MSELQKNPLDAEMPPLKITCTSVDCEHNLHCFLKKRGMRVEDHGSCRACGARLVDWPRLHRRDPSDTENTFKSLKFEVIRHHMWHVMFDDAAARKAKNQGRSKLYADVKSRLRSSIGKAAGGFDGRQTPLQGRVVYYAQHATATCCRKCMEYWHGIPKDRALTEPELEYAAMLVRAYLDDRLPDLQDEAVPRPLHATSIRKSEIGRR